MRLDKFICDTLNMTRSDVKKAVSSRRVAVNGVIVRSSSIQVDETDTILLDQQPIQYQKFVYIMLNKPAGYVCANRDSKSKTVFDLLPPAYKKKDLFVCGRLDKDTTGLVLITNNGEVAHRLLAPKKCIFKEYLVTSREKVNREDVLRFEEGITLSDGHICKPAYYEEISPGKGTIRISEGKFHQIKRMFHAVNNEVVALHRKSIHGLSLDSALEEGSCRYLNDEEVAAVEAVY